MILRGAKLDTGTGKQRGENETQSNNLQQKKNRGPVEAHNNAMLGRIAIRDDLNTTRQQKAVKLRYPSKYERKACISIGCHGKNNRGSADLQVPETTSSKRLTLRELKNWKTVSSCPWHWQ